MLMHFRWECFLFLRIMTHRDFLCKNAVILALLLLFAIMLLGVRRGLVQGYHLFSRFRPGRAKDVGRVLV